MRITSLLKTLFVVALFALAPALANAQTTTIDFSNSTGIGQTFTSGTGVLVSNIKVTTSVVNPFDPSHPTLSVVSYNVPFVFDTSSLHLIPNLTGAVATSSTGSTTTGSTTTSSTSSCASLSVTVKNAYTGLVLSGASVTVGSTTLTTNSSGVASFTGLPEGAGSLTVAASGYTSSTRSTTLSCTESNSVGVGLNPTSGAGAVTSTTVRIVLNWGANPRDLDSHLTGPTSSSTGVTDTTNRFHVYYSNKTADVAKLDVDDTSGLGPETITISPLPAGTTTPRYGLYRYSVYHYAGTGTIATSGATVVLNIAGTEQQFRAPSTTSTTGSSTLWTVFEWVLTSAGHTVYPINTYSTVSSSGSVTDLPNGTSTGYGDIERGVDFSRLPPK